MKHKRDIILSASAIGALKFCPVSFYNKYILGIRKKEDTDARRIGNAWHEGLDIMATVPETPCKFCASEKKNDPDCYLCGGTGYVTDPYESLARMLNKRYTPPTPFGADKYRIESSSILHAILAYQCHYEDQQDYEVVFKEIPFRIPLVDPCTRKPVPGVFIDGMLDKLIRQADGSLAIMEHKSTSSDLDNDSTYWGHLKLDTQVSLYVYAMQRLQTDGALTSYKIMPDDPPISDIVYDVWRKPQIKPKKLSASDTLTFIETGQYYGASFDVAYNIDVDGELIGESAFIIDGEPVPIEHLKEKKGQVVGDPVVSETPEMFGARLFNTIVDDPERYFQRKLISRTPEEIERFEYELFSIYQTIEQMNELDSWYHNEQSCEARFRCDFIDMCYTGRRLDPEHPPAGFECIFRKDK